MNDSEAAPVENPFDLAAQVVGDGLYLSGYIAVIKLIDGEGKLVTQFVAHEMNNYETVGVLAAVLDRVRATNAGYDSWDEDEEEE